MKGPTTNHLLEGVEAKRASKLIVTSGTIWPVLRNGPSNCDASENRIFGGTLYSSSTEKEARKSSQRYSLFPKPEENKHWQGFELWATGQSGVGAAHCITLQAALLSA